MNSEKRSEIIKSLVYGMAVDEIAFIRNVIESGYYPSFAFLVSD